MRDETINKCMTPYASFEIRLRPKAKIKLTFDVVKLLSQKSYCSQ